MKKIVYVLNCVDTEGPLYESLEATFGRLDDIFGIKMEPSEENLRKIQNKEIDFGNKTDVISEVFSSYNINYNDTWDKLDKMLFKVMSPGYRDKMRDSFGNGWVYNWFCLDHVGYAYNPRRRDIGVHNIFDHYKMMVEKTGSHQDGIHWHFHPMSTYKEAHRCATSYINSPHLYEILCRRAIERQWFPVVSRAGFQTERPDSHWFLEQWIPFDPSNTSYKVKNDTFDKQFDCIAGRSGDWRLAPDDWSIYQPSHDNYQLPGNCRRYISRCLAINVRGKKITQEEVIKAFARANEGKPTMLGIVMHDFRDMESELEVTKKLIYKASNKYPAVKFKFCEARQAFRLAIYGTEEFSDALELGVFFEGNKERAVLKIETLRGKVFGPQPFLAVKTKSQSFIHDNLDFDTTLTKWSYTFDYDSIHADDIDSIGIAANDKYGNTFVKVIKP